MKLLSGDGSSCSSVRKAASDRRRTRAGPSARNIRTTRFLRVHRHFSDNRTRSERAQPDRSAPGKRQRDRNPAPFDEIHRVTRFAMRNNGCPMRRRAPPGGRHASSACEVKCGASIAWKLSCPMGNTCVSAASSLVLNPFQARYPASQTRESQVERAQSSRAGRASAPARRSARGPHRPRRAHLPELTKPTDTDASIRRRAKSSTTKRTGATMRVHPFTYALHDRIAVPKKGPLQTGPTDLRTEFAQPLGSSMLRSTFEGFACWRRTPGARNWHGHTAARTSRMRQDARRHARDNAVERPRRPE